MKINVVNVIQKLIFDRPSVLSNVTEWHNRFIFRLSVR